MNRTADPSRVEVSLREWQTVSPDDVEALRGRSLGEHPGARDTARALARQSRLTISELATGLTLRSESHVGSVDIGPLRVIVRPKIPSNELGALLRYSVGLSDLTFYGEQQDVRLEELQFQDLLLAQLVIETRGLFARGVRREYQPHVSPLAMPRGRVVFKSMAERPWSQARPVCRFVERSEDVLANRLLAAGLSLGASLAVDQTLAGQLRFLASHLNVGPASLDAFSFQLWERTQDRLTTAYKPSLKLVQLLASGLGRGGEGTSTTRSNGFFFDMNLFFQELIGRFLRAHLSNHDIRSQHALHAIYSYDSQFTPPRRRHAPMPRPDFAIARQGAIVAILDAKYRDLWNTELPSNMLYQLSVYALSQRTGFAAIVYPALDDAAREVRIVLSDPVQGTVRATIALRPLHIRRLAELLFARRSAVTRNALANYATYLAFGTERTEAF